MSNNNPVVIDQESTQIHPVAIQQERHLRLVELALTNKSDIQTIEKLVQLQYEFEAKEARKSFFDALANFQTQIPVIEKKGFASFTHRNGGGNTSYSFAKIEDIVKAIAPFLAPNGLSYRFEHEQANQFITVTCIVTHRDGHQESTAMTAGADNSGSKNLIQQVGSTISYLKRYTLQGALGLTVSEEDDDAQDVQPAQQEQSSFYPDEQFNASFPKWMEQIESGAKTPEQILSFLAKKGVNLNQNQIKIIKQVSAK